MSSSHTEWGPADSPARAPDRRAIGAAVACNALEFFDFVAYAFFAVQIGRAFFPSTEPQLSLLLSVAVFGVGFFARPVGSVVIGWYADRAGRKPALLLTAALMTAGTLGLAICPSHAAIGGAAAVIVTLCRLVQGFALGGEIGPSTAFLLEAASAGHRASFVSLQVASQGAAALLAGSIGLVLSSLLGPAEMAAWGWRVPFALGALLVPVALYLRTQMPETLGAVELAHGQASAEPAKWRLRHLFLGVCVIAGGTVSTYVGNYMATYATTILKLPPATGLFSVVAIGLATMVGALAGGRMADRVGRWPILLWPRLAAAILTVPAFMLLTARPGIVTLLAVSALLALLTAMNASGVLTTICELFPPRSRATALAVVYSVGVSLFGGSTQWLVTWLIGSTGSPLAPAWYVVATSAVAVVATIFLPETLAKRIGPARGAAQAAAAPQA